MSQKVLSHSECMKFSSDREIAAMRGIRSLSASKYSQPRLLGRILIFFDYFWSIEFSSIRATIMPFKVCQEVNAQKLIRAREELLLDDQSAQWISSISITRSNLNIFWLFLKHWIQLNQSYNYVFQSMWNSQRAEINSSEERCWQLSDRAVSTLNIFDLICWVKPSYFFEIFESLNWSRSTLQSSSAKVLHQRTSSRRSRQMIDRSRDRWSR